MDLPGTELTDSARMVMKKGEVKIQIPADWTATDSSLAPEPIATTVDNTRTANNGIDLPVRFDRGLKDVVVTLPEEAKLPDSVDIAFSVNAPGTRRTDRFIVLSRASIGSFKELENSKGTGDTNMRPVRQKLGLVLWIQCISQLQILLVHM